MRVRPFMVKTWSCMRDHSALESVNNLEIPGKSLLHSFSGCWSKRWMFALSSLWSKKVFI